MFALPFPEYRRRGKRTVKYTGEEDCAGASGVVRYPLSRSVQYLGTPGVVQKVKLCWYAAPRP